MSHPTGAPAPHPRPPLTPLMPDGTPAMTMRVYRRAADGRVIELREPVRIYVDPKQAAVDQGGYPPCRCPIHQADR